MREVCDVIAYGDTVLDIIVYLESHDLRLGDSSIIVKEAYISPGGAAANTAVALSRLGFSVCLVTTLGSDIIGRILLDDLIREGVKIKYVKTITNKESGFVISIVQSGDTRTLLSYRGVCSDNIVNVNDIEKDIKHANIIYTSGYVFNNVDHGSSVLKLFKTAHEYNVRTFLELGGAGDSHTLLIKELLNIVDYVSLNKYEVTSLMQEPDVYSSTIKLYELLRPRAIFIKAGNEGSLVFDGYKLSKIKPCVVKPLDPTGCGDAFNAGVILGLLRGLNPVQSALLGNIMGAYKSMGHSARFLPKSLVELTEFARLKCGVSIEITM